MMLNITKMDRSGRLSCMGAGVAVAVLLGFATTLSAARGGAGKPVSARAKQGDAIFHQRCVVCHNKQPGDTTPFGPPNLNGIFDGPNALKPEQAETIITNGKGRMPSFGTTLTRSEISDVIAYLKTR